MRGRRPKPSALKAAQGNPGHRAILESPAPPADQAAAPAAFPFKISADAQRVYDLIAPGLKRLNFLRASDEPAFRRYCDTMSRYWRVTEEMERLGGETYECATVGGGTMLRLRPQFVVQERLARRLDALDDRFGLTPMARQQYLLALSRGSQLSLLPDERAPQPADPSVPASPPRPPAIGALRGLPN
jgi:P27 family predicted phage terminase small subunit